MNAADPQKTWRKAVALINCDAGAAAKRGQRNLAKEITSACLAKNIHVGVVFAADREISNNLKLALDKAKAGEIDIVMVGGGDGTISSAAHLFARTEIPLGVMSLGTLNHFARDIGIPSAVDEAIATIAEGATRRVDVGTANGRTFINNSSIGAYPYIVLRRDQLQKRKRLSKWLAMSIAVFRVASRFRIKNLSLTVDGYEQPCRSPFVFIGNNEYNLAFPKIGARESLEKGRLWICAAEEANVVGFAWRGLRALFGAKNASLIRTQQAPRIEVNSKARKLWVAFDGEVRAVAPPIHYAIVRRALIVYAPGRR